MKACYKNDLKKAYLILEGVESEAEDYQIYMLKENTIPGLLKTDIRYVDLCWRQTAYCWIRNIFIARKRNFISVIFRGVSVN